MLLRHEVEAGLEVLTVTGEVTARHAGPLADAVQRALALEPRGVVLDLSDAGGLCEAAVDALAEVAARVRPWPHPGLVVCGATGPLRGLLAGQVRLAADRDLAQTAVDDRPGTARERVVLEHGPQGPSQARAVVRSCAERFGLGAEGDDLLLLTSELVTNAVRYARPPVELEISADDAEVTVAVADGSPGRPTPRTADADAEGGRGLALVDLLAVEHGVRPEPCGKTVWAAVRRVPAE